MKNLVYLAALVSSVLLLGCAGGKVKTLEDQVAQEQARKAALQTQVDFLQANLNSTRATNDSLSNELKRKDEVIRQFAVMLDSLRTKTEKSSYQYQRGETATPAPATPLATEALTEESESAPDLPPVEKSQTSGNYQADYDRALDLFHQRKYTESAALFETLLNSDRAHKLAGNCQFWMGECLYAQGQYEASVAEYEKVFAFPKSFKIDAAQYKIALCYLQLKKYPEARDELNRLISKYPSSEYVGRARTHLDQLP